MMVKILLALIAMTIIVPVVWFHASGKKNGKQCLLMNAISFFSLLGIATVSMLSGGISAVAAGDAAAAAGDGLRYIGAALATGISGIGGGIAVASAASAAIGAISENEKIMGKTLIFVALAEGIALYGLVISFMILNA